MLPKKRIFRQCILFPKLLFSFILASLLTSININAGGATPISASGGKKSIIIAPSSSNPQPQNLLLSSLRLQASLSWPALSRKPVKTSSLPSSSAVRPSPDLSSSGSFRTDQASETDPFYFRNFEAGKKALEQEKYEEALRYFEVASFGFVNTPSLYAECLIFQAAAHLHLGHRSEALSCFEALRRPEMEKVVNWSNLPSELISIFLEFKAFVERQEALVKTEKPDRAKGGQKLIFSPSSPGVHTDVDPTHWVDSFLAARNYLTLARQQNNPEFKVQYLRRVIELDPTNLESALELARALREKGDFKEASNLLEKQRQFYRNNGQIYIELGLSYFQAKDYERAINILQESLRLEAESAEMLYLLGKAWMARKRYGEASRTFERLLEIAPGYRDAPQLLASCRKKIKESPVP